MSEPVDIRAACEGVGEPEPTDPLAWVNRTLTSLRAWEPDDGIGTCDVPALILVLDDARREIEQLRTRVADLEAAPLDWGSAGWSEHAPDAITLYLFGRRGSGRKARIPIAAVDTLRDLARRGHAELQRRAAWRRRR